MSLLDVLPVKKLNNNDNSNCIPYPLPKPEFLMTIVSPVNCGKTNFITNIVLNENYGYKEYFGDKIIIISPTILNDETAKLGILKSKNIQKITDDLHNIDAILEAIVELQEEEADDDDGIKPCLIILDDMLGYLKPHSYFEYLTTRFRHYKISLVVSTQSFRKIPSSARFNTTSFIVYKSHNQIELKKIHDEFEGNYANFSDLYKEATDEKYSFLYLNIKENTAWRNFTKQLEVRSPP